MTYCEGWKRVLFSAPRYQETTHALPSLRSAPFLCVLRSSPIRLSASQPSLQILRNFVQPATGNGWATSSASSSSDFQVIDGQHRVLKPRGHRISRHLPVPASAIVSFVRSARLQAFRMPGGRIYVSRKIVAFLRNEDELAGLLGQGWTFGCAMGPQQSRSFREVRSKGLP
jgi:hypothetical protein